MSNTIRKLPYRGVRGVSKYIVPGYGPVRKHCRELIDRAVKSVSGSDERYRWRVDRVAIGWRLVELTLDAMQADIEGLHEKADRIWIKRKQLLTDNNSVFALAPAAADRFEILVPLRDDR